MTTTAPLPRCLIRGCPARFRDGPDRLCRDHGQPDSVAGLAERITQLTGAAPGGDDEGHDQ